MWTYSVIFKWWHGKTEAQFIFCLKEFHLLVCVLTATEDKVCVAAARGSNLQVFL